MKFSIQSVDSDKEIYEFYSRYNNISYNSKISFDYLKSGNKKVTGFFIDNVLSGGFIVNTLGPLRYVDIIKDADSAKLNNTFCQNAVEVTGFWINDDLKKIGWSRPLIFWTMLFEVLKSKKKYIVGGALSESLRKFHMMFLPKLIISDEIQLFGKKQSCWIYYGTRYDFAIRLPVVIIYDVLARASKRIFEKFTFNDQLINKKRVK